MINEKKFYVGNVYVDSMGCDYVYYGSAKNLGLNEHTFVRGETDGHPFGPIEKIILFSINTLDDINVQWPTQDTHFSYKQDKDGFPIIPQNTFRPTGENNSLIDSETGKRIYEEMIRFISTQKKSKIIGGKIN